MKKPMKITLLVIAALTIISSIAAIVMLNAISGDALFYMDSTLGNIYAISYRWVCLVSIILILFWGFLGIKNRTAIKVKLAQLKPKPKIQESKSADVPIATTPDLKKPMFCTNCGKQQPSDKPFCPFCGKPVKTEEV